MVRYEFDDDEVLRVSTAAMWRLAESGGAASVHELAAAAGISRSTFHRMFPRKEDCVRPATRDTRRMMMRVIEDAPARMPLLNAYVHGFAVVAEGAFAERTRRLLPVVTADTQLWSVWADEVLAGTADLADVLQRRGAELTRPQAEVLAVAILSLTSLVLRDATDGADAVQRLRARVTDLLHAIGQVSATDLVAKKER